ncbi:MAG: hypothetical protein RID07_06395 [Lacipirellulaceae bacterium]
MGETLLLDIDANPLESIELTNNRVTLSPRSINKIVMAGQDGDAYK